MTKEGKKIFEAKSEKEVEKEVKQGNISLILEDYQDIFSDFDPRSYSEKALSDDFLEECKRAVRAQKEGFELRLMMPSNKRSFNSEAKIRKRLKEHFQKHYLEKQKEIFAIRGQGLLWFLIGTALMIIDASVYNYETFIMKLIKVMIVPAGWFSFWEGLGKIFIVAEEKKPEYDFYKKMASCQVYFLSY